MKHPIDKRLSDLRAYEWDKALRDDEYRRYTWRIVMQRVFPCAVLLFVMLCLFFAVLYVTGW